MARSGGDCELYTSCEPCPMCLGAIYWARLSRVYFASTAEDAAKAGFDDSFIYSELKQPHSQRRMPTMQIMRDEALAPGSGVGRSRLRFLLRFLRGRSRF